MAGNENTVAEEPQPSSLSIGFAGAGTCCIFLADLTD
jgi:hypothetical protein